MNKETKIMAVFFVVLVLGAGNVWAEIIEINITAEIAGVFDPDGLLNGQLGVGDILSGSYTYDSAAPDSNLEPNVGDYWHYSPPYGVTLSGGGFTFRTDPDNVEFLVQICNDSGYLGVDNYLIRSYKNLPLYGYGNVRVREISWRLEDSTGTVLSSEALPTTAPVLEDWDDGGILIDGGILYESYFYIMAPVTSVELVPITTYYVDAADGSDDNDGLSPETAFATIQKAINTAHNGDTVIVADGNYTGPGNRDIYFLGKAITVRSIDPNDPNIVAATIIDCQGTYSDPHRGFKFLYGEGPNSVLAGVTITNGWAPKYEVGGAILCDASSPTITKCNISNNYASPAGGGIHCRDSSPTINKCTISSNTGKWGSGIFCFDSSPTINNCTISGNMGSGIVCQAESSPDITSCTISDNSGSGIGSGREANPTISDCRISGNTTSNMGGGISCEDATITNCIITGNSAEAENGPGGGGIYCESNRNQVITNCIITGNRSRKYGGGICGWWGGTKATISNCIIKGNVSGDGEYAGYGGGAAYCNGAITNCVIVGNRAGGGKYGRDGSGGGLFGCNGPITNCTIAGNWANEEGGGLSSCDGEITNCILWDNWPEQIYRPGSVTYSNVQGGWEGIGNIDVDPLFALETDYHLMPGSPCIDAGDPNYVAGPNETDLDGNPRALDGDGDANAVADMGAYEYALNSPSIAVSALSFYFVQDWPKPDPQTLQTRNCGGQPLQWEIVEDCNWLEAAPTNGVSSGQINEVTITVDPNGLAPGLYSYDFKVQDPDASNSPVTIRVTMPVGTVLRVPSLDLPTIQDAIDVADNYDIVLVADGNYTGTGNKNLNFDGKPITVRSENGPNNCTIDCENSGRGFYFQNGERENSVVDGFTITNARSGILCEESSPAINNCTIRESSHYGILSYDQSSPTINNCTITGNFSKYGGGGIHCQSGSNSTITNCTISENSGTGIYGEGSSLKINNSTISGNNGGGISCGNATITNCTISNNSSSGSGGGIRCGSAMITNCTISNNTADYTGGIYCYGNSTITNCTISDNSAESTGGVYCASYHGSGGSTITNCIISGNTALNYGGIYVGSKEDDNPTITNCIITGNSAGEGYAGLSCWGGNPTITNCTITGNTAGEYSGGIHCEFSNPTINNCIFWGNEAPDGPQIYLGRDSNASVSYTDAEGGEDDVYIEPGSTLNWGTGNTAVDPGFAFDLDYHLMPDSPCIDTGDPNYIASPDETDLDGNPRIIDGNGDANAVVDVGAYEFNPNSPSIAVSALSFYFIQDWPETAPQSLLIRNCGGQLLHWEIVEDCNWLEAAPANGVSSGQINEVTLTVDPNGLAPGLYSCTLTVQDPNASNSPVTVQVELRVRTILRVPSQDFPTIQDAIDAGDNYDMVLVADDTYTGEGNKNLDFDGKPLTVRSENGPDNCVIDCENSGRGFHFSSGEKANSIVQGFTITNGYADGGGGGILCYEGSPTISNCIIRGNVSRGFMYGGGGGISCYKSSPMITNCNISGNSSDYHGGAIYCEYGEEASPIISHCTITSNSAGGTGGGIFGCKGPISNCVVSGNSAATGGGGLSGCDGPITNCTIAGNSANDSQRGGGGLLICGGPIRNCLIWDNVAPVNSQLCYSTNLSYNCIQDWTNGGQGNICDDPCFVVPGYWDTNSTPDDVNDDYWVEGDYHLLPDSLCINAGDPNYVAEPKEADLDGLPRIIGGRVDMGAYEFNHLPVACIVGGDRTIEAGSGCEVWITLDGSCSSDGDSTPGTNDDIVSFDWYEGDTFLGSGEIIECNLPLGEHAIVLEVTDKADAFDSNEVTITVEDNTPPEFTLSVSPGVLWPANHKMVKITPTWTVSDNCDESPEVTLVGITSNEDDDAKGDGHTSDDIQISANGSIYLRAERSGKGSGRVYTITYQAVDDSGNVIVGSATVTVPHDKRRAK